MSPGSEADVPALKEEIRRLGPWHLDVQVTPEVSTRAFLESGRGGGGSDVGRVRFISGREDWVRFLTQIYPEGLEGRSFLDCACNCGAYSFWSKELGAGDCFGFDVRDHWIDQARFLLEHRTGPSDGIRFEQLDLYELPEQDLQPFDIVLFKGILYHLPDPITGLKLAADLAKELIIVDTAIRTDLPDGLLAVEQEPADEAMSGVYGLNWYPTGPGVLADVLRWLGFVDVRTVSWNRDPQRWGPFGRMRVVAARRQDLLDLRSVTRISSPKGAARRRWLPRSASDLAAAGRIIRNAARRQWR